MTIFGVSQYALILEWALPLALAMLTFLLLNKRIKRLFELLTFDRLWHVFVRTAITIGVLYAVWIVVKNTGYPDKFVVFANEQITNLKNQQGIQKIISYITVYFMKFAMFVGHWFPIYERAYVIIFTIGSSIAFMGLYWQIRFIYTLNIFTSLLVQMPILGFKYFLGYQTPIWDKMTALKQRAQLKENANDAYEQALRGRDEKGEKFQNGQGGSVSVAKIKNAALAIRRAKAKIVTDGINRTATFTVHMSREVETNRLIMSTMLKGFGRRLNASNIRFADDPRQDDENNVYVFDSKIAYNAGSNLGSWRAIFANPFDEANDIRDGGRSPLSVFADVVLDVFRYVLKLSPMAIYYYVSDLANTRFKIDNSIYNAKYEAHQNLDLSVIPVPEGIDALRKQARLVASKRINAVSDTLNTYNITAQFIETQVGGNTATYVYSLPKNAKLNINFETVQTELANALNMTDIPLIRQSAGRLYITMVNGISIPVSFVNMIENRRKGMKFLISGMLGVDAMNENIYLELGDKNPHGMGFGKTGTGKTVTIETFLYSLMSAVDPSDVRIMYVDGKGNSFEHMKYDGDTPNPYTYAPPADASGDIEYARALIKLAEKITRERIDLFKQCAVSKLEAYNKLGKEHLPEILFIVDEFSAITQQDKNLKPSELAEKGTIDTFEYIAKMSRSTGIRLLMANQSARKELVPGKITANITGRFSLGVTEPIESEIAMPETGIALHRLSQAGEFYSTFEHGNANPDHGNSPYLDDNVKKALNKCLIDKFGHLPYAISRDEVMGNANVEDVPKPEPMPTAETPLDELYALIEQYPAWAVQNRESPIFKKNVNVAQLSSPKRQREARNSITSKIDEDESKVSADTHKSTGDAVASVTSGIDKGTI